MLFRSDTSSSGHDDQVTPEWRKDSGSWSRFGVATGASTICMSSSPLLVTWASARKRELDGSGTFSRAVHSVCAPGEGVRSGDAALSCPVLLGEEGACFFRRWRLGFSGWPGQRHIFCLWTHLAHAVRFFTWLGGFQQSCKFSSLHGMHLNRVRSGAQFSLHMLLTFRSPSPTQGHWGGAVGSPLSRSQRSPCLSCPSLEAL